MSNLILPFFLISICLFGQNTVSNDYFNNPIEIPLVLAGSFGELRNNHFHSGLDIKTQQREGIPIYAPANGYVNRIKVAHFGYGKALYLKHPNGYITVYAHLQRYAGDIQMYVKENQYQQESFEIELFPDDTLLLVKKGDLIGYSGNTGSSGGPHLHFEIRDASSRPMNPMMFGISIPDTKKPLINSIIAYPIDEGSHINQSQNPLKLRLILQKDGTYQTEKIKAIGKIGFGISTNDQMNGASNKNGVYQVKSTYNGEEVYRVLYEKFSFDETRYLNRFIDYSYFKKNRIRVQKLFRESNNPLSIIKKEVDKGFLNIEDGFTSNYTIEVKDYTGNSQVVIIPIIGGQLEHPRSQIEESVMDYIVSDQATSISKGKFNIYIPANSLYESTYLDIVAKSDTLQFHKDIIPIHKNITITIDAGNYAEADRDKLFIGRLNYKGKPYFTYTTKKGEKLSAKVRTFGAYTLVSDNHGPTIKAVNFTDGKWISQNKTLKIKIDDGLSGISNYRATLNGKFILMEYNYKKDVLTYDFDDAVISETENKLKIIVVDNVGNSTTFDAIFFRKQL